MRKTPLMDEQRRGLGSTKRLDVLRTAQELRPDGGLLDRAWQGTVIVRGSPEEFREALRLAVLSDVSGRHNSLPVTARPALSGKILGHGFKGRLLGVPCAGSPVRLAWREDAGGTSVRWVCEWSGTAALQVLGRAALFVIVTAAVWRGLHPGAAPDPAHVAAAFGLALAAALPIPWWDRRRTATRLESLLASLGRA